MTVSSLTERRAAAMAVEYAAVRLEAASKRVRRHLGRDSRARGDALREWTKAWEAYTLAVVAANALAPRRLTRGQRILARAAASAL